MRSMGAQVRRPFVREVGVLQLGAIGALGVGFLLSVLLARLLGPAGYGSYALVVSTMTTISLLKRLGQDYVATTSLAEAYARGDAGAARNALANFNFINIWSTIVVIPLALLLAPTITGWSYGDAALGDPLRLALLPPIWALLPATLVIALQCSHRLVALAVAENTSHLALATAGLLGVLLGGGVTGVFLGQAAASLALAILAWLVYQRLESGDPLLPLWATLAGTPPGVWRTFRSGLAVALDKNLVSLYPLAPVLLLGAFAPTDQVAMLRVAMSYLAVPLLALSAISRLLMVKLPELHATQPERVRRFFLQVTVTAGGLSILLTLPFVLLAPWLIGWLFGSEFADAARLVPLLALDPLLAGFGIAAGPIFRTYGRNVWAVWANLCVLLVGLPLAYVMVQTAGLEAAALAYALLVSALRLVAYGLSLKIVSQARA